MSIIAVSFTYLEKVQKDAGTTSALIQANLLHGNTVDILKKFFPTGSDNSEKLTLIYTMPLLLSEETSNFSVNLMCQALMVAAPLNWLTSEQASGPQEKSNLVRDVLRYVIELYEIEDPNGLEALILQSITGETLENEDYEPRLKRQKGIVSKQQFDRILKEYALEYDDQKVFTIPWEKYFSFVKVNPKTKIDANYLSAEFISAAFDIPIEIIQDSWIIGESTLSTFLRDNAISTPINNSIYSNKALNAMHCVETFAYKERLYEFKFNYIEGRSNNFEFNGQK